jgi:hypothetical protein
MMLISNTFSCLMPIHPDSRALPVTTPIDDVRRMEPA